MVEQLEISPNVFIDASALVISFSRSSGPGGQNVNKLSTKAELRLDLRALESVLRPTAMMRLRTTARNRITREDFLQLSSQEFRTQEGNRAAVLEKLSEMIATARIEPKVRRPTKVSRAAKRRRLDAKKHRGGIKSSRRAADLSEE